jgi:hypothetical protein
MECEQRKECVKRMCPLTIFGWNSHRFNRRGVFIDAQQFCVSVRGLLAIALKDRYLTQVPYLLECFIVPCQSELLD